MEKPEFEWELRDKMRAKFKCYLMQRDEELYWQEVSEPFIFKAFWEKCPWLAEILEIQKREINDN